MRSGAGNVAGGGGGVDSGPFLGNPAPDVDAEWNAGVVRYMADHRIAGPEWPYNYAEEVIGDGNRDNAVHHQLSGKVAGPHLDFGPERGDDNRGSLQEE